MPIRFVEYTAAATTHDTIFKHIWLHISTQSTMKFAVFALVAAAAASPVVQAETAKVRDVLIGWLLCYKERV
jgi:hypothetical protein